MALLRQVGIPGSQASWTETLYDREYKIVNGEVEVENPTHIQILEAQGFKVIGEEEKNVEHRALGVIRYGESNPKKEDDNESDNNSQVQENVQEEESNKEDDRAPLATNEPQDTVQEPPKKRGRGRPRKTQGAN